MYISEITIQNFRIFSDFKLKLNAGLNVIIGENNAGKTALIDAIRLTLDTTSSEWTKINHTDFHRDQDKFCIQVKFTDINPQQAAVFIEHLTHEGETFALYVNLKAHSTEEIRRGNRYIRTELKSGAKAEGPMIEREIRDYLSATYLKPLRDAEDELSAGRYSRLAQIISSSKQFDRGINDGNFQKLVKDFIEASKNALANEGLNSDKDQISSLFKSLSFKKDRFTPAIHMLGSKEFGDMSSTEKERAFQDILQKLSLVLDENTPQQGLGYNNALFMATELLLLEQEKDAFPLLLIEEPEGHLHPQLQMKFLKTIRDRYAAKDTPQIQTILTTHSPNLASKAPLENIILMHGAKAYPMRKGETELEPEDYVFLEKFLDVTKSNLFFAKGVLIVEGDAENILLPTIAKLLGHPLEDYGVSIVNVGSTAYAKFANIFLRQQQDEEIDIPVACLRDLDLWPLKADKDIDPKIGWKDKKHPNENGTGGNLQYWVNDENIEAKKKKLKDLSSQKVKVCVSDEWTFEYCLIRSGLGEEIQNLKILQLDKNTLKEDEEEKAIQIYGAIEKAKTKTDVAYQLAARLEETYDASNKAKRNELLGKLPNYIKEALQHVLKLETLELSEKTEEGNEAEEAVANAAE